MQNGSLMGNFCYSHMQRLTPCDATPIKENPQIFLWWVCERTPECRAPELSALVKNIQLSGYEMRIPFQNTRQLQRSPKTCWYMAKWQEPMHGSFKQRWRFPVSVSYFICFCYTIIKWYWRKRKWKNRRNNYFDAKLKSIASLILPHMPIDQLHG